MSIKLKHKDKIFIKWLDHCAESGWHRFKDIDPDPVICKTTAWFVKETNKTIVITHTFSKLDHYVDPFTILKSTILKLRKIERAGENE